MLSRISFWNPYYTYARKIHAILFVFKIFFFYSFVLVIDLLPLSYKFTVSHAFC